MVQRKQYTTDLKDEEWRVLKPYLLRLMPERKRGRKTGYRLRVLINAARRAMFSGTVVSGEICRGTFPRGRACTITLRNGEMQGCGAS